MISNQQKIQDKDEYEEERKLDMKNLEKLVEDGYNNIPLNVKKAILVIGNIWSGKSILIKALAGRKLDARWEKQGLRRVLKLISFEGDIKVDKSPCYNHSSI